MDPNRSFRKPRSSNMERQEELFIEIIEGTDGQFEVNEELFELLISKFEYRRRKKGCTTL